MKLTKTDHNEQSLRMDRETTYLIREAFGAMLDHQVGSVEMRDRALEIKRMLEDPDREDRPALFQKTHGILMNCPDCAGTRLEKHVPYDRNEDPEYNDCETCKGTGQLYLEIIRKGYVPTDYHRRKLTK